MGYRCDCGNHYGRLCDLTKHTAKCKVREKQRKRIDELAESFSKAGGREAKRRKLKSLEDLGHVSKHWKSKGRSKRAESEVTSTNAASSQSGPSREITYGSASSAEGKQHIEGYDGYDEPILNNVGVEESIEVLTTIQYDSVCLRDSIHA